jgi:glycosyltransferase involved in cell wall biosynthesis
MAAYNRAELIHVAIDSVLAQDFKDYELVIVDDGSTDATPAVVRGYDDPRIRYIRKERNEGRSPTRNRAIAEARGEFVLWMADDDLLSPNLLTLYDGILQEEPHIDVIYGKLQLFDHDTGRDLNLFTPNDWTGRDMEVIGAKLYGSCVPDGGTATRRKIYGLVGPGPYDHEFVRAQDYELWTRMVGHARFRFVDEVVYRYRKHSGGTSWGEFIDLTMDSKIIRRHLKRHPLRRLFPHLDWQNEDLARNQAYLRIAKNLQMYGDFENSLRFLDSVHGHDAWPEAIEQRTQALLGLGKLALGKEIIETIAHKLGRPHLLQGRLEAMWSALSDFCNAAPGWLKSGQYDQLVQSALRFDNQYFQTYHTMFYRGQAHEAAKNLEEALHCYCLAARLNPRDDLTAQAVYRLRTQLGGTPKTDLDAMRRRLAERFVELPLDSLVPQTTGPLVSVVVTGASGSGLSQALSSVLAQRYTNLEVILAHCDTHQVDDRRVRIAEVDPSGLTCLPQLNGVYVAWIDDRAVWTPEYIGRAVAVLKDGASAVASFGHLVTLADDGVSVQDESLLADGVFDAANGFADEQLPLSHLVHRRPVDDDPHPRLGPYARWDYALQWLAHADLTVLAHPGVTRTKSPDSIDLSSKAYDGEACRELISFYKPFTTWSAFNVRARDAQNQRLHQFGIHLPRQGRSTIIILCGTELDGIKACLERVSRCTHVPCEFILMIEPTDQDQAEKANAWASESDHIRVCQVQSWAGMAKQINDGFARANGEFVTCIHVSTIVTDYWLGRLQWYLNENRQWGAVVPTTTGMSAQEGNVQIANEIDGGCVVFSRRVLDKIGGMDVTLAGDGLEWQDYVKRLRIAGFQPHRVSDVVCQFSEGFASPVTAASQARFDARWGSNVDEALQTYDRSLHFCSPGAEEGFRPDSRPVVIEEAADRNILVMPPWDQPDELPRLLESLSVLPLSMSVWLRCEAGRGAAYREILLSALKNTDCAQAQMPKLLIVDARLAPEREAGLYRAASAVYVEDHWAESPITIRRASDCSCLLLRGRGALEAWRISDG